MVAMLAAIAAGTGIVSVSASKRSWDEEARLRKADYIFMEALSALGAERYDDYYRLLDRAYGLDTASIDISAEWGALALASSLTDSIGKEKAYGYVRRRFLANPSDYATGVMFTNIARRLSRHKDVVTAWELIDSLFPTKTEPAVQLANAYIVAYITGDTSAYDKAIAIYERLETGTGKDIGLSSQKIRAYNLKHDTLAITGELNSLLSSAPYDSQVNLFVGSNYEMLSMPDSAIGYYNRACELDSANGNAYLIRANFYKGQGDSVAFDREVFHALKSPDLEFQSKIEMLTSYVSELYTDSTQHARIENLFDVLQEVNPGEADLHTLYGSYLYQLADYTRAAEQFSYAVSLEPNDESMWISLVQLYDMASDTANTIKSSTDAMHRFPEDLYFPIVAASTMASAGREHEAIELLDNVDLSTIINNKAVSNLIASKGEIYYKIRDFDNAFAQYEQAIELDPQNYMAMNNAAYYLAEAGGDLDKAEKYSSTAVKSDPENPTYLDTYAWVFFKKKEYSLARQYIDMTLNLYDTPQSGQEENAETEDSGHVDVIEETASEIPGCEIYEHAGDIYFMTGDPDEALVFWKKALETNPDSEILRRKVSHKTYFFK